MRAHASAEKKLPALPVFLLFIAGLTLDCVPPLSRAVVPLSLEHCRLAFGLILLLLCLLSAAAQGLLLIPPLLVAAGFLSGQYAALTGAQVISVLLLGLFVVPLFCLAVKGLAASRVIWAFLRIKYRHTFYTAVFTPAALAAAVIMLYFLLFSA